MNNPLVRHRDTLRQLQRAVVILDGPRQVSLRDEHVRSVAPPVHVTRGVLYYLFIPSSQQTENGGAAILSPTSNWWARGGRSSNLLRGLEKLKHSFGSQSRPASLVSTSRLDRPRKFVPNIGWQVATCWLAWLYSFLALSNCWTLPAACAWTRRWTGMLMEKLAEIREGK